jgi:hypothetical protein
MTTHANAGLATIRVAGRLYPARYGANCKTCRSPHRQQIEEGLVAGEPYSAIVDELPAGHDLSARNLRDHWLNDHLGMMEPAVERFREQLAAERGEVAERGVTQILDYLGFVRGVLSKAHARLQAGELQPSIKDGLAAAKLLAALESPPDAAAMVDHWREVILIWREEVSKLMTPDQLEEFQYRVDAYPRLRPPEPDKPRPLEYWEVDEEDEEWSPTNPSWRDRASEHDDN